MVQDDDILFVDLGPVFAEWEADFGRTFVLGDDPVKKRLQGDLEPIWNSARDAFWERDGEMSGEELYSLVCEMAKEKGWEFGGPHSGHLIGDFPHERIPDDKISLYITRRNGEGMVGEGKKGDMRHWILEVHLVDRDREIGGFMEQLLTVREDADGRAETPWLRGGGGA